MPAQDTPSAFDAPYLSRLGLEHTLYKVNIDHPLGAQIRHTADGMAIYMLFAEPGIFYNDHGRKVPDQVAAAAGYDIEKLGKARRRQQAMKDAMAAIDADYTAGSEVKVVAASGEYRVVEIAEGYFNIEFVDDTVPEGDPSRYTPLNVRGAVSQEVAMRRFQELTGSATADVSQPTDADVEKAAVKRAR